MSSAFDVTCLVDTARKLGVQKDFGNTLAAVCVNYSVFVEDVCQGPCVLDELRQVLKIDVVLVWEESQVVRPSVYVICLFYDGCGVLAWYHIKVFYIIG